MGTNQKGKDDLPKEEVESPEEKKVVLETMLEVEEKVLHKLEKSKFPNSVHENAQRTEIIIAKKMKVDVIKDTIEEINTDQK
jgi:hypothetical protein